jgi:hypothetical protein
VSVFASDQPQVDGSRTVGYGELLNVGVSVPHVPTVADQEKHVEDERVLGEASDRSDAKASV